MNVTLKGSVVKQYPEGIAIADVAKDLGMGLYKAACVAKVNGELCDLRTLLDHDCQLEILTFDAPEGKKTFWHTASHVLAQAVKHLFPHAKLAIGPAVDNGFYYDVDCTPAITQEDLARLEAEMQKIIKTGEELERFTLTPEEAKHLMEERDEPYKVELIEEHSGKGESISLYRQGDFVDLCAGPHLLNVSPLKAVKLTSATGAYWRGDANNTQLVRVYGTCLLYTSRTCF